MKARQRTVLVLGAGASAPYGFPLGSGLKESLINLQINAGTEARLLGYDAHDLTLFSKHFADSGFKSIDAFLGQRTEFVDLGKRAIAHAILGRERPDSITSYTDDDWYIELLEVLLMGQSPEEMDFSWLTIVTFNYDRSLEYRLYRAVRARFDFDQTSARRVLERISILHVYGSLGDIFEGATEYAGQNGMTPLRIARAASGLRVIPEGRDDDPSLVPIKYAVQSAQRIAFLGFGYDAENLRRIGFPRSAIGARIVGTTKGLTGAERMRAQERICGTSHLTAGDWLEGKCSDLLRHTLILD